LFFLGGNVILNLLDGIDLEKITACGCSWECWHFFSLNLFSNSRVVYYPRPLSSTKNGLPTAIAVEAKFAPRSQLLPGRPQTGARMAAYVGRGSSLILQGRDCGGFLAGPKHRRSAVDWSGRILSSDVPSIRGCGFSRPAISQPSDRKKW